MCKQKRRLFMTVFITCAIYLLIIPLVIACCFAVKLNWLPELPSFTVVLLIDLCLLVSAYIRFRIWRKRYLLFSEKELNSLRFYFYLTPIEIVWVLFSIMIVLKG